MNQQIPSKPKAGDNLVEVDGKPGKGTARLQRFMDDIQDRFNRFLLGPAGVRMPVYTVTTLPPVPDQSEASFVFVSDMSATTAGAPAYHDGSNWRRFKDDSIVT